MATGHTYPVIEGKITTLEEFASECAKSFVWSARDTGEIRYPETNSFHKEGLYKSIARLEEWDSLDEEGRYAKWSEYAANAEISADNAEQEAARNYERLIRIQELIPEPRNVPEEYQNFVSFMHDQIDDTIKYDGTFNESYYNVISYTEWCETQRGEIVRTISIRAKAIQEEEERVAKSRAWIDGLVKHFGVKVQS